MSGLLEEVLAAARRGYAPDWARPGEARVVLSEAAAAALTAPRAEASEVWLLLTTYVAGASAAQTRVAASRFLEQVGAAASLPDRTFAAIAIQHRDDGEQSEAEVRARALAREADHQGVPCVLLLLRSSRKQDSINALIEYLRSKARCVSHLGWFDDDVDLEEMCIAKLVRQARSAPDCAIGAAKKGRMRPDLGSRIVYVLKNFTRPAMNYPHGCAIVVPWSLASRGIPSQFASEDGYVCFELLDPAAENPYAKLLIVDDARVEHLVGAGPGRNARRIRRMLLNHWIMMVYYPHKARLYLSSSLFWGFWPISPLARERGLVAGLSRWLVKGVYFTLFAFVGIELIVRGQVGRPIASYAWS